jgi:hypothetical protein
VRFDGDDRRAGNPPRRPPADINLQRVNLQRV